MFPGLKLMNIKETLGPVPPSPVVRVRVRLRVQMLRLEGFSLHDTEPGAPEAVFSPEGVRADGLLEGGPQWGRCVQAASWEGRSSHQAGAQQEGPPGPKAHTCLLAGPLATTSPGWPGASGLPCTGSSCWDCPPPPPAPVLGHCVRHLLPPTGAGDPSVCRVAGSLRPHGRTGGPPGAAGHGRRGSRGSAGRSPGA